MKKRKVFWTFKREKLFLFEIQERIYLLRCPERPGKQSSPANARIRLVAE